MSGPRKLVLPDSGALQTGARRFAPSAGRNIEAILGVLTRQAPMSGRALEIASGTGQQIARFASALPGLDWQPSDIDPANIASIDDWAKEASPRPRPAITLDAARPGWAARLGPYDLIILVNLLHLISADEVGRVLGEVAEALSPGGRFALYGPFLRDGHTTSPGDAAFDASLRQQDPEIGYKDLGATMAALTGMGLRIVANTDMPANNVMIIAERPAATS